MNPAWSRCNPVVEGAFGEFLYPNETLAGGRAGRKEALDDSCDILCISGAEVTEIWRYRSPSCWNIQLSLTSTIYELAVGSAGFWKVSEVSLFCWITMKTSQLVAIIIMTSLPALYMSHGGLKLPKKVHPFDGDNRHAVHENQHLRPNPGTQYVPFTK